MGVLVGAVSEKGVGVFVGAVKPPVVGCEVATPGSGVLVGVTKVPVSGVFVGVGPPRVGDGPGVFVRVGVGVLVGLGVKVAVGVGVTLGVFVRVGVFVMRGVGVFVGGFWNEPCVFVAVGGVLELWASAGSLSVTAIAAAASTRPRTMTATKPRNIRQSRAKRGTRKATTRRQAEVRASSQSPCKPLLRNRR